MCHGSYEISSDSLVTKEAVSQTLCSNECSHMGEVRIVLHYS